MDSVLRAVAIYVFLLVVFRLSGKRTLSDANTFDLLMLLVISETTQQAMVNDDHSMTRAFLLVITFVMMSVGLSLWKQYSKRFENLIEGVPVLLLQPGKPIHQHMNKVRVDEADILDAARRTQGLERFDQIKYAILERNGEISIVPTS